MRTALTTAASTLPVALAMALLLGQPTKAAEPQCVDPATPLELAICGDPAMQHNLEMTLPIAYATAIGGLTPSAEAEMARGQAMFWNQLDRACTIDAEPLLTGAYDKEGQRCLAQLLDNRIGDLQWSMMLAGQRYFLVTRAAAAVDENAEPQSGWRVATWDFLVTQMDGDTALARNINAAVWAAMTGILPAGGLPTDGSLVVENPGEQLMASARVIDATAAHIAVQLGNYSYPHGALHGSFTLAYVHYLIGPQRKMVASDVFDAPGWQDDVTTLVWERLVAREGENLIARGPEDIAYSVIDPGSWRFTETGLEFQFQSYQVLPYSAGAPTIEVSWSDLGAWLAPGADRYIYTS